VGSSLKVLNTFFGGNNKAVRPRPVCGANPADESFSLN